MVDQQDEMGLEANKPAHPFFLHRMPEESEVGTCSTHGTSPTVNLATSFKFKCVPMASSSHAGQYFHLHIPMSVSIRVLKLM